MKHCSQIAPAHWHLLMCKPNQNHIAFRNLKELDFELFMPRHKVQRRWRGRLREEIAPVFAGYMFIASQVAHPRWDKVRTTPGVSQLVRFGTGDPATVPAGVVAGLMGRCDAEGLLAPIVDDIAVGDTVRVISGPFYDFVTSIEEIEPGRRLHVLLDLLGRPTRVQLKPTMVTKAASD